MQKIFFSEMIKQKMLLEKQGHSCTLLGIGPMSHNLIEASLRLGKEKDFPVMFIASRNQIDTDELGGGYVCNWNQKQFVQNIKDIAEEVGFEGLYYICRDHGGPWQRDKEKNDKLHPKEAMKKAKESYLADLVEGFDLLHIDPTKNPHFDDVIPLSVVIDYTVELIEYIEEERRKRDLPSVSYEVGTEETNGGLTSIESYNQFIKELNARLSEKNLPIPSFIVGQTGTLTRLTENVGNFDALTAKKLSDNARAYGVGVKEHNADYLSDEILYMHPYLGITAANVAPEFGVVETRAYLMLGRIEQNLFKLGLIKSKSDIIETIKTEAVNCGRWRKWMVTDEANYSEGSALKDEDIDLITQISGHYTLENKNVKQSIQVLYANLNAIGFDCHQIVVRSIMESINRYVDCFKLTGVTTKIRKAL